MDCSAPYGEDGWCDVVIPNEFWNVIAPEGGMLCFRCMTKRLQVGGFDHVPVLVASGPYEDANEKWRLIGLEHGRGLEKAAIEVLSEIQWRGHNNVCPICRRSGQRGHDRACRLAILLPLPKLEVVRPFD